MKLFTKFFKYSILFAYSVSYSNTVPNYEIEKKCGDYFIKVVVKNPLVVDEQQYELYFRYKDKNSRLIYKNKKVFSMDVACVHNTRKHYMVLYQNNYGGNVGPEDNYGIFDLNSQKMLIDPKDWPKGNENKIQQILGYAPPVSGRDKDIKSFFCCDLVRYWNKVRIYKILKNMSLILEDS